MAIVGSSARYKVVGLWRKEVAGARGGGRPLTDDNLIALSHEPMSRVRSSDPKWSAVFIGTFPWVARHGSVFSTFAKRGCIISDHKRCELVYFAKYLTQTPFSCVEN